MSIPENRGYHVSDIPRGEFGQLSKITEEYLELVDANTQGVRIMEVNELADLLGAVEAYASTLGFTLSDLIAMKERTASAFASGDRVARQVPAVAAVDVNESSDVMQIGPVFDKLFVVATVREIVIVDPVVTRIYVNTDEIRREHCWDIAKDLERLDGNVIWRYDTLLSALRSLADGPTLWPHWSTCQLWTGTLKTLRVEKQVLRVTLDTTKPPTNVASLENLVYASIDCVSKTTTVIETDYGAEDCGDGESDLCADPESLRPQTRAIDGADVVTAKAQPQIVGTNNLCHLATLITDSVTQQHMPFYARVEDTSESDRAALVSDIEVLLVAPTVTLDTLHTNLSELPNSAWGTDHWRSCSLWLVTLVPNRGAPTAAILVHTKPGLPMSTVSERIVRKLPGVLAREPATDLPVLQAPEVSVQGYTIQCIGDIGGVRICCTTSLGHFTSADVQKLRTELASSSAGAHNVRIQAELSGFTGHVSEQVRARYYASELHLALVNQSQDTIWSKVCFIASTQDECCAILIVPMDKRKGTLGWRHYTSGSVSIMVPADADTRDTIQAEELAAAEAED